VPWHDAGCRSGRGQGGNPHCEVGGKAGGVRRGNGEREGVSRDGTRGGGGGEEKERGSGCAVREAVSRGHMREQKLLSIYGCWHWTSSQGACTELRIAYWKMATPQEQCEFLILSIAICCVLPSPTLIWHCALDLRAENLCQLSNLAAMDVLSEKGKRH
jgi:hypothetical protein